MERNVIAVPLEITYMINDYYSQNPSINTRNNYQLRVYCKDINSVEGVEAVIKKMGFGVTSSVKEAIQTFKQLYNRIVITMFIIGIIILLQSSMSIATVVNISVIQRKTYLGMIKTLGASKHVITTMFLFEGMLMGVIGFVPGVAVSFVSVNAISKIFIRIINNYIYMPDINIYLEPSVIILSLLSTVIVSALAAYFPARKVSKLEIVNSLNSKYIS